MSRFLSPNETFVGTTSGKDSYWDNVYANNLLSSNEGLFTQNVTAYEFIGIGKQLTQVFGTDITKLPLAGGELTGPLTGTVGLFTTSLSSPNVSGSFYGNGSGLTGVSGIDGSKLPLAGGVLTGPLTGTIGLFTTSLSSPNLSGSFYGNGSGLTDVIGTDPTKLPLSGGRVDGYLVINGSLTALSSSTFVNTIFTTTSAISVVNTGAGPALYVFQTSGPYDIASFYDQDYGEVFHIGNDGKIGVRESNPNKELTVNGEISANNDIWANKFRGDGSLLTNVIGTDPNKLPLSGGNLSGPLTGTEGLFTTSLSAVSISGNFFGDGSGLTNVTGIDSSKLPLSGGTLTGGITGTTAVFNSISAASISGTFYGDTSNGLNAPRYYVTCRIATNQLGVMNTSVSPHTFTYNATGAIPTIDGVTVTVGDIILFGGQTTLTQSGPWRVVNAGSVGVSAVLERPNFFSGTVKFGTSFTISKGTSFQGSTYNLFSTPAGINDITVGFTNLAFGIAYTRGTNNATNSTNTFVGTQTLAIGTTALAPLRFQAGTLLTTPVQHTVEWDGNFMYLTTSGANSARTTNVAFVSAPATSSSYGLSGQVAYDSSFFYVCTAANTWTKIPLTNTGVMNGVDGNKLPLSGGTLTGGLTGTNATFTNSISSPSISGTFYGDGSRLTGLPTSGLQLSGGTLTGGLTGTTAIFTTSISSVSISGTFYGDGSRLTGLPTSGLQLSGGTLTGGLTGTNATFTNSISSPSISGTFYGDGSYIYNIPSQINFIFDGGGSVITTNSTGIVQIPYNIKIVSWTILANAQANAEVQVLTSNYSNHPTYGIISGLTNTPKLINASKAQSSTMSDWVTAIPSDSYLQFTVIANDTANNLTVSLKCLRTS